MPDTNTVAVYATCCASTMLTFALVLITAYYARQTKLTVDEMKEGRRHSAIPVITCELEVNREIVALPGLYNKLVIQNIGNSPALETVITLRHTNPDTSRVLINPQEWRLGVVGIDQPIVKEIDKAADDVSKIFEKSSSEPSQPRLEITSISQNSYGVTSKTVAEFELQIIESQQEAKPQKQPVWKKLKEPVTVGK